MWIIKKKKKRAIKKTVRANTAAIGPRQRLSRTGKRYQNLWQHKRWRSNICANHPFQIKSVPCTATSAAIQTAVGINCFCWIGFWVADTDRSIEPLQTRDITAEVSAVASQTDRGRAKSQTLDTFPVSLELRPVSETWWNTLLFDRWHHHLPRT